MSRTAIRVATSLLLVALAIAVLFRTRKPSGTAAATSRTATGGTEAPLWAFGLRSTITDSLPRELDSLVEWGDYEKGERPVVHAFDANRDGRVEFLVRSHSRMCGNGGCPIALLSRKGDGTFADVLGGLHNWVFVTDRYENGWVVLWVEDGGRHGGVFRLTYDSRSDGYAIADTLTHAFDTPDSTTVGRRTDSLLRVMNAAPVRYWRASNGASGVRTRLTPSRMSSGRLGIVRGVAS